MILDVTDSAGFDMPAGYAHANDQMLEALNG